MLSIIVSWRDRIELKMTISKLVETAQALDGELIVVNFDGSRDELLSQVSKFRSLLKIINVENEPYFCKPRAQNIGASVSSHPILFFCDCDIIVDPDCIKGLANRVSREDGMFATLKGVRESKTNSRGGGHVVQFGYELRIRTADGRSLTIMDHEEDALDGTRDAPGLLLVRRNHFLEVHGYNSRLPIGWGWEDQDMIARLTLGAGLKRHCEGVATHISHDDISRMMCYPETTNRWDHRDKMFRSALKNYDEADFNGSFLEDKQKALFHYDNELE